MNAFRFESSKYSDNVKDDVESSKLSTPTTEQQPSNNLLLADVFFGGVVEAQNNCRSFAPTCVVLNLHKRCVVVCVNQAFLMGYQLRFLLCTSATSDHRETKKWAVVSSLS
jgi:hypothetical protein